MKQNKCSSERNDKVSEPVETKVSGVLDMLEQEFQVLTAIEEGRVLGGSGSYGSGGGGYGSGGPGDGDGFDVVDWLLSPLTSGGGHFDTTGLTDWQTENLRDTLNNIAGTSSGKKLLDDYWMSGESFEVTDEVPQEGYASYDSQNQGGFAGTINAGSIVNTLGGPTGAEEAALGHELFHGYEDINGINMNTTNAELDAYMFGAMITQELGNSNPDFSNISMNDGDPNTTADQNFGDAWDAFLNGNHSMDNYNELFTNFGAGSRAGGSYDGEQWTSTEPTTDNGTILGFISGPDPDLIPPNL